MISHGVEWGLGEVIVLVNIILLYRLFSTPGLTQSGRLAIFLLGCSHGGCPSPLNHPLTDQRRTSYQFSSEVAHPGSLARF